jgi:uncharacterized lipoprotein YajG
MGGFTRSQRIICTLLLLITVTLLGGCATQRRVQDLEHQIQSLQHEVIVGCPLDDPRGCDLYGRYSHEKIL